MILVCRWLVCWCAWVVLCCVLGRKAGHGCWGCGVVMRVVASVSDLVVHALTKGWVGSPAVRPRYPMLGRCSIVVVMLGKGWGVGGMGVWLVDTLVGR